MAKVVIKAVKMLDADATHISLVDRGANRRPFKIVKQEKPMSRHFASLDLTRMFARKAEEPEVQIVGIATMKGERLEEVKKSLEDAGFSVADIVEMEDNSVVFKQEGTAEGDGAVIRISEDVALVMKNFTPHDMDVEIDGLKFSDAVAAQGFYPSVTDAMASIADSIPELVGKSESADEAAELVAKMFDEAKLYATTMIGALPSKAFKLEHISKAFPKTKMVGGKKMVWMNGKWEPADEEGSADQSGDESVEKADASADATPAEAVVADPAPVDAAPVEAVAKALTLEDVSSIVSTHTDKAFGELAKKMEESLTALSNSMTKSVSELTTQVTGAVDVAKKAEAAIKGAVVPGSDSADRDSTRKSETSMGLGGREIDTGYMSRAQRQSLRR